MTDRSTLGTEEELFVTQLLHDEDGLGMAMDLAKRLNAMLRHTAVEALDHVLVAGASTMLSRFTAGLRRDFDAINAALELPWTTSPVDPQFSDHQHAECGRTSIHRAVTIVVCTATIRTV